MPPMHPEHRMLLTKAAMSRPTDSSSLQKKVKALESLIAGRDVKGNEVARTAAKEELVRVIRIAARLGTARSQAASSMAGRLLSELDSIPVLEYPSETPSERVPRGYWPYGVGHPDEGDPNRWEQLHMFDTQGDRDRWRSRVEGKPPWRLGVVLEGPEDEDDEPEPDSICPTPHEGSLRIEPRPASARPITPRTAFRFCVGQYGCDRGA